MNAHDLLCFHIQAKQLPEPVREYRYHDTRRWRFDLAWPKQMLAVEIDGGTWTGGRHTRGRGYMKDCEKLNMATELGWRCLRYTTSMVESGEAINQLERILGGTNAD